MHTHTKQYTILMPLLQFGPWELAANFRLVSLSLSTFTQIINDGSIKFLSMQHEDGFISIPKKEETKTAVQSEFLQTMHVVTICE